MNAFFENNILNASFEPKTNNDTGMSAKIESERRDNARSRCPMGRRIASSLQYTHESFSLQSTVQ